MTKVTSTTKHTVDNEKQQRHTTKWNKNGKKVTRCISICECVRTFANSIIICSVQSCCCWYSVNDKNSSQPSATATRAIIIRQYLYVHTIALETDWLTDFFFSQHMVYFVCARVHCCCARHIHNQVWNGIAGKRESVQKQRMHISIIKTTKINDIFKQKMMDIAVYSLVYFCQTDSVGVADILAVAVVFHCTQNQAHTHASHIWIEPKHLLLLLYTYYAIQVFLFY